MRIPVLLAVLTAGAPPAVQAQVAVELSWGLERNVDSPAAETDGWFNTTVEWRLPSGLGLGIGSDHQFDGATPDPRHHQGFTLHLLMSQTFTMGAIRPFLRGGVGLGRLPCEGDVCRTGLHLRGSGGMRLPLSPTLELTSELGVSRVSRPFGGVGVALLF